MTTEKPRRLGPLQLDLSKQSEANGSSAVPVPLDTEREAVQTLEDSKTQRTPVTTNGRKKWLLATGAMLFVGVGAVAVIPFVRRSEVTSPRIAPSRTANSHSIPAPTETWMSRLHSATCAAPCCGGAACQNTLNNQGKRGCKFGESACSKCTSGITCIPGECGSVLAAGEIWSFHLSAIAEKGVAGSVLDACKTKRDLWLCVRSKDRPQGVCLSQLDACRNQARSAMGAPITSDDLVTGGFDVDVRLDGPDGPVLASKSAAKYAGGVDRRSLCNGLIVNYSDSSSIAYVTFYLDVAVEK